MTTSRGEVIPAVKVSPEAISKAIGMVGKILDLTDYGESVTVGVDLRANLTLPETAYAWMLAAMLIAEKAEIDTGTLRALQTSIWRGSQDVLWY